MKFIMLINVKMLTIGGILTFVNRINTTSENSKKETKIYFLNWGSNFSRGGGLIVYSKGN